MKFALDRSKSTNVINVSKSGIAEIALHGYPKNEPGKANLNICSKNLGEEFKCLSQTLEMPFKQNDNIPDEVMSWSSERSIKLGESVVNVLLSIVDDL